MSPIEGYSCYYCSNKTLYKENFVEQEINGKSRLFCINCAGYEPLAVVDDLVDDIEDGLGVVDDRDYVNYDKAMAAREALFLLESESSFFLFGESAFILQDEAHAAGDEHAASLEKEDFFSILNIRNDVNAHLEDDGDIRAREMKKGGPKHVDVGYRRGKAATLAVELLELGRHEPDLSQVGLDIIQLFQDAGHPSLTDMQKRDLRIALKNIKRRGHA